MRNKSIHVYFKKGILIEEARRILESCGYEKQHIWKTFWEIRNVLVVMRLTNEEAYDALEELEKNNKIFEVQVKTEGYRLQ